MPFAEGKMKSQKRTAFTYEKPWIAGRADPYVLRAEDGSYYFTASLPAFDSIALRHAAHLRDLPKAKEQVIWRKHGSGPMSFNIWAPELHFLDGAWYLYFAASDKDDIWQLRPYVLTCRDADPVTGTWEECGQMQCAEEDPFSFRAGGRRTADLKSLHRPDGEPHKACHGAGAFDHTGLSLGTARLLGQ